MFNFIPAIIALVIAASYRPDLYKSPPDVPLALVAGAFFIALSFALSSLLTDYILKMLALAGLREAFPPGIQALRRGYWALVLISYAALIHVFRWPEALPNSASNFPLVRELFSLVPFYAAVFLGALPSWRLERALRPVTWTRGEYVLYTARQYILPAVPFFFFTFAEDLMGTYTEAEKFFAVYPSLAQALSAAMVAVMFFMAPLLIRFFWPAENLPPGELRTRLESLASRAGVKMSRIYVWKTGGGRIMNAAVTGIGGVFRYIFITDALMENLTPEEIEGVFAHEISHAKHNHLVIYMILVLTLLFGLFLAADYLDTFAAALASGGQGTQIAVSMALVAGILFVFWYFVFGAVSRALEQQADLSGAILSGNFESFINALEKLAAMSGASRRVKGWRHHSIERRVSFLAAVSENPDVGMKFLKRLLTGLAVILALFTAGLIAISMNVALDLSQTGESVAMREMDFYAYTGRTDNLEAEIRDSAEKYGSFWAAHRAINYSRLYEKSGAVKLGQRFGKVADEIMPGIYEKPEEDINHPEGD